METIGDLGRAKYFSLVDEFAHKSVFVWPDISCASCGMSPLSERALLNHGFKFLLRNQETSTSFGPAQKLVSCFIKNRLQSAMHVVSSVYDGYFLGQFLHLEDGGSMISSNFGEILPNCTASHPRTWYHS
jgi:hypothetical protein